jgi:DNA-binding MarR family transcriptional regulator
MQKNLPIQPAESIVCLAHRFEAIANKYVFKPMGLSSISMKILKLLKIHGTLTASEMIETLDATKSNLSQRLNFLEKENLIIRSYASDKKDKRKIMIKLTKHGEKVIDGLEKRFHKAQISLEEKFSESELNQCQKFIAKVHQILDCEEKELEKIFK